MTFEDVIVFFLTNLFLALIVIPTVIYVLHSNYKMKKKKEAWEKEHPGEVYGKPKQQPQPKPQPQPQPKQPPQQQTQQPPQQQTQQQQPKKKSPVLAIISICLIGLHILSQFGSILEVTGGIINADLIAYTVGALLFVIVAFILMIIDTVNRK